MNEKLKITDKEKLDKLNDWYNMSVGELKDVIHSLRERNKTLHNEIWIYRLILTILICLISFLF